MKDVAEQTWDLVVLGGGTAGIVAAKTASRLGARVALVERDRTGGDCLWTGCVPSKSLLAAAHAAAGARRAVGLGVEVGHVEVDFSRVMQHVRGAIRQIEPVDSPEALRAEGVTVLRGEARVTGPDTVEVESRVLRFHQAVLATGAAPAVPPVPGLDAVSYLTSDDVWDLEELPDRLVVVGGGSIGCELGQAFARLGSRVTLIEGASRLLTREDPDAAAIVHRSLTADGVEVITGHPVASVEVDDADGRRGTVRLDGHEPVDFDRLLVAVGRSPRTDELDLDAGGIGVDERGFVTVDRHLRTTNPRVWAAGDLTGHPQLTHLAGTHGSLAASNAVLGLRRSVDRTGAPRVTFTEPEVAAVGLSTQVERDGVRLVTVGHDEVDRAVTEAGTDGLTRLALDRRGRILGATIVAPRAGEMLGELSVAVRQGLRARDLAAVTHPYPTWNDGPWNAALADVRRGLEQPGVRRATGALVRTRRWWRERRSTTA